MTRLINYGIRYHPRITCALICAIGMIPLVMAEMTTWGEI